MTTDGTELETAQNALVEAFMGVVGDPDDPAAASTVDDALAHLDALLAG